jgi:hypothetical protein
MASAIIEPATFESSTRRAFAHLVCTHDRVQTPPFKAYIACVDFRNGPFGQLFAVHS